MTQTLNPSDTGEVRGGEDTRVTRPYEAGTNLLRLVVSDDRPTQIFERRPGWGYPPIGPQPNPGEPQPPSGPPPPAALTPQPSGPSSPVPRPRHAIPRNADEELARLLAKHPVVRPAPLEKASRRGRHRARRSAPYWVLTGFGCTLLGETLGLLALWLVTR